MHRAFLVLLLVIVAGCREEERAAGAAAAKGAAAKPDSAEITEETRRPLWEGDRFPDIELRDLEGRAVRTGEILGGKDTIVLFASTSCEACHDLVAAWTSLQKQWPEGLTVVGIVDEEVDLAVAYVKESRFPFPLYCDTKSLFYTDYLLDTYPTVAGVGGDGTVLYMVRQASPLFTPEQAALALARAKDKPRH